MRKYRAWFKSGDIVSKELSFEFTANTDWTECVHPSRVSRVDLLTDKWDEIDKTWIVNEDPDFKVEND